MTLQGDQAIPPLPYQWQTVIEQSYIRPLELIIVVLPSDPKWSLKTATSNPGSRFGGLCGM